MDKHALIKKLALAGILLAIVLIMQSIKNIPWFGSYIAGPIINTVIIFITINLGIYWGIGFSLLIPLTSLLIAPGSPMTTIVFETKGLAYLITVIGNLIYVLFAFLFRNKNKYLFISSLIIGALLKWLFMWGLSTWVLSIYFKDMDVLYKIFMLTQLCAGLISVPIIVIVQMLYEKINKRTTK